MLLALTSKSTRLLKEDLPDYVPSHLLPHPFGRFISRLKYKTDLLQFAQKSEHVPDLIAQTKGSLTWAECCEKRALDLLNLDRERYYLSYSGGIDSSVALVSILKYWPQSEVKRLTVYLSHESILENPSLFKSHVSNLPLLSSFTDISARLIDEKSLMISGDLGDQLFGADIMSPGSQVYGDETLKMDFNKYVPLYIATINKMNADKAPDIFEYLRPIVDEAPFKLKTTHDFFWWLNFTQKWQYVKFRFLEKKSWDLNARYESEMLHFFDDIEFQKWSLCHHEKKMPQGWTSYKFAAKEFLTQMTGDPAQMALLKVQSLASNYSLSQKRVAIDENYVELSAKDLKNYVVPKE